MGLYNDIGTLQDGNNLRNNANKLFVTLFIIAASALISGCPNKSAVESKPWFKYASKYVKAMRKMSQSGGKLRYYDKAYKIGEKFLQSQQPAEDEIITVLTSPVKEHKIAGLAAMSIKPIETDKVTDILFEFLKDKDWELRWFARCALWKFKDFPESRKDELGNRLLEIMNSRKANELSLEEIMLLQKFPSKESAHFLTEQIMREGNDVNTAIYKACSFQTLKRMGGSYYDDAADYIRKNGSPEIKEELSQREESWAIINKKIDKK